MRSARCSTRCAKLRQLPTNVDIAIVVAFVVGVLLYGIGTSIMRSLRVQDGSLNTVTWPQLVDESLVNADPALRLDIVERLSIIAEPWCADVLRQALKEENDARVKSAIADALNQTL
jgi:hypothetical protein